jgi:hypothetical protein
MQILKKLFISPSTKPSCGAILCIAVVILTVLPGMRAPFQDTSESKASQVKAVFLYNFTQFVVWPQHIFNNTTSPFVIGVLGENTFGSHLNEVIEGEEVDGHPIVVRYYTSITPNIDECQILFIDKSFSAAKQAIESLKGKPVLTVSDSENFMRHAGMLRFYIEGGKFRIEINQEASRKSGLEISSKLLRIATLYKV